jgi:hypothetical protein
MPMGRDCVFDMQPSTWLLFMAQMIYEYGAQWNDTDRGKPKNSDRTLSKYRFVHHKSHMD